MSDAMLLVGASEIDQDIYYKTHFLAPDPFIYFESDGRRVLVASPMECGRATKEGDVAEVRSFEEFGYLDLIRAGTDPVEAFTTVMERIIAGHEQVQVQGRFPVAYADALRRKGIDLDVRPDLLRDARRRKSDEEIEAIAEAQRATERALASAVEIVSASEAAHGILHYHGIPLTSERLRSEIEIELVRQGYDPGTPIVAGGPGAADPHFIGSGPLRSGESIVLDIFPRSKASRYFADLTRTIVHGEPSEILRRMYESVLAAQEVALAALRPGADGAEIHAAVLQSFEAAGFGAEGGPKMDHGTGHGVGLDIHELPRLSVSSDVLQEGDVVTIEPGLYDPTIGGVRIEDLVVITGDGYRNLTSSPKQFEV